MKAALCREFKKPLVIEDVDLLPVQPGEIKVRLAATAVCHSDIHVINGDMPFPLPGIPGHEAAGYVEEVGEGVTDLRIGDHVVMAPITGGCGRCVNCMMGLRHMCLNWKAHPPHHRTKRGELAATMSGPVGAFAEYTVVQAVQTAKIPDDVPMDRASMLGCAALTGFGAVVNRAQVRPFQSVAVIGAGGVGLFAIQGAAFSGAFPIIAVDVLDSKLKAARTFGATDGVNSATSPNPVQAVKDITGGRGVDHAFLMVGSDAALRQGFEMLGPRGSIYVIGMAMGPLSKFNAMEFISERSLSGAMLGSTKLQLDVPRYAALYKAGKLKLDEMVSGRYPLSRINEAIKSTADGAALRNIVVFE